VEQVITQQAKALQLLDQLDDVPFGQPCLRLCGLTNDSVWASTFVVSTAA
jgi:hypothetical protein